MLKFSEIFEFAEEIFRKIPILKEFEWFEWFGPSPIEPFNSVGDRGGVGVGVPAGVGARVGGGGVVRVGVVSGTVEKDDSGLEEELLLLLRFLGHGARAALSHNGYVLFLLFLD